MAARFHVARARVLYDMPADIGGVRGFDWVGAVGESPRTGRFFTAWEFDVMFPIRQRGWGRAAVTLAG